MEGEKGFRILNTSVKNLIWAPDVRLPGLVKDKTFWGCSNKDYYKSTMELTFSTVFETHSWFFLCSSELKGLLLVYRRRFIWLSHQKKATVGQLPIIKCWMGTMPGKTEIGGNGWAERREQKKKKKRGEKKSSAELEENVALLAAFSYPHWSHYPPCKQAIWDQSRHFPSFQLVSPETGWYADCLKFHWKYFKTVLWLEISFFHLTSVLDPGSSLEVMGKGSKRVCRCLIRSSMQCSPSNFPPLLPSLQSLMAKGHAGKSAACLPLNTE